MENLKVQIEGVYKTNKGFMVALKSEEAKKILPIFVSEGQAQSIGIGISEKNPPRPLTHDIFLEVMGDQDLEIEKVTVDDLLENTFTAEMRLKQGNRTFPYDLRPSDAIALAVRMDADVYVDEDVMERAGKEVEDQGDESREMALKRFRDKEEE